MVWSVNNRELEIGNRVKLLQAFIFTEDTAERVGLWAGLCFRWI